MRKLILLIIIMCVGLQYGFAQTPASRSFIIGIGTTNCTSGSSRMQYMSYEPRTNTLVNTSTCAPSLSPAFSNSRAVIDYNPKDNRLYYIRRVANAAAPSGYDSHIWSWVPGTCPVGNVPSQFVIPDSYVTVAHDMNGNGWMINFIAHPTIPGTFAIRMRMVDFATGTFSPYEDVALPPGVNIYQTSGDYLISPNGVMFLAYNNKLLTIDYQNYGSGTMNATYIDTISLPSASQNLVGMAYAGGDFLASFVKAGSCAHNEVDLLTGVRSPVVYGGTFGSFDNTSVSSSLGVAKQLVSLTSTGTPGQYDVVYDVHVNNIGNYPITNIQVIDSLNYINGLGNVVSASAAMQSNPGGLLLNAGFNGTTNATLLQPFQTLKNFPVAENNVVIRITARISNIIQGQIYKNSAVATGLGFSNLPIRDSSTNGSNPDLNLNQVADDPGEGVPTPFVITIAGEYPPCPTITTPLHTQDFGSGVGLSTAIPGSGSSTYTPSVTSPIAMESYSLTNNANLGNPTYWNSIADHTGNANGKMMVVNADVNSNVIYTATVNNLCSNLKYSFIVWAANLSNQAQKDFCAALGGYKQPRLIFRVRDGVTGLVLTNLTSGDITNSSWQEYGMRFILPTGYSSVILEVINEGEGGCGNDVAIDDIQFGLCDPTPSVNTSSISAGCVGGSTSMSAALSDPTIIAGTIEYQWQSSADNISFTDISGANSITYTIPSVVPADAKYYRVIVASAGNINNVNCRYVSASFLLTLKTPSVDPVSMSSTATVTCANDIVTLSVNGGSLGTNANWVWYMNACGGSSIGTGPSLVVQPGDTTTYYVRAEGDCNNTTCVSLTINAANCVVLPFSVINLDAVANNGYNRINFSIMTDEAIGHVEVLRSTNGRDFEKIGTVSQEVPLGRLTPFYYEDRQLSETIMVYYYKIRVYGQTGKKEESRVVVLKKKSGSQQGIKLTPNPASSNLKLQYVSDRKETAQVRILDHSGRIVYNESPMLTTGQNNINISNIEHLPNGMYIVVFIIDNQTFREKIIIKH